MKNELKKLYREQAKTRTEINRLEDLTFHKNYKPQLKKMVGKCFAYRRNCYSSPSKESDYWDVFRKVLMFVDTKEGEFHFIYEEFSVDSYGKVSFFIDQIQPYTNKEWWGKNPFSGYERITETEYEKEREKMYSEVLSCSKMRKILNKK